MSKCETCRDKDWCSGEEMDQEECPVIPKVNFRSLVAELCNDYCMNCVFIYKSSRCTDCDCICARVREIIEGGRR